MTTEVKDVLDRLLHFHFNNVEEHRGGGPMVQMDKASLREANDLRAAESRATAAEGRVALLEGQVEQAFRDGLAYATNVKLARPEEHDIAWLQSLARARLATGGQ